MEKIKLGKSELMVPKIAVGCMRIDSMETNELVRHLDNCMNQGLNFFDHADIYGGGACERKFAEAVKQMSYRREEMIIQSKCGIVPQKMYDFSKEYILKSVDGILQRLDTEYLDLLVLHRPDALVEPEEVAEAFDSLKKSGKVRYFGVSNHKPMQIELLSKYLNQDILVNQMQLSIPVANMIANGLEVNMMTDGAADRDGSVLDYCRLKDITIQTWSPFQFGFFEGIFVGNRDKFPELNDTLDRLAAKYNTTSTAIAAAWIFRHPAKMQLIAGTTNLNRMNEIISGANIILTREEWYELYLKSGHILP